MECDLERGARAHSIHPTQIRYGLSRVRPRLIADRERLDAPQLGARFLFPESGGGGLIEPVCPASPRFGKPLFECFPIDPRDRAAGRADNVVDARKRRLIKVSIERRELPGESIFKDCAKTPA